MIAPEAELTEVAREVAQLNRIPFETALDYLWRIGDTPEIDERGEFTVVRDDRGNEVARIIVPSDED